MREWLRQYSELYRRLYPVIAPTYPCTFCGAQRAEPGVKHFIGFAWTDKGRFNKWCDGTETPVQP